MMSICAKGMADLPIALSTDGNGLLPENQVLDGLATHDYSCCGRYECVAGRDGTFAVRRAVSVCVCNVIIGKRFYRRFFATDNLKLLDPSFLEFFFLMILAIGSIFVLKMSITLKAVGSILLAAPIELIMGMPCSVHRLISSCLAAIVSMQSST